MYQNCLRRQCFEICVELFEQATNLAVIAMHTEHPSRINQLASFQCWLWHLPHTLVWWWMPQLLLLRPVMHCLWWQWPTGWCLHWWPWRLSTAGCWLYYWLRCAHVHCSINRRLWVHGKPATRRLESGYKDMFTHRGFLTTGGAMGATATVAPPLTTFGAVTSGAVDLQHKGQ